MSGVPNARTPCFGCIDSADRGSLAIERQADTLGLDEVRTRLKKVRSRASSSASVADSPIFGQELVRAEEADRACVSDVCLAASSEWMRAHRLVRRQ